MRTKTIDFNWRDIFMVGTPILILTGFYYTTNWRLQQLENQSSGDVETVKKVAVLEQRVIDMDRKIDFIYDAVHTGATSQKDCPEKK